MTVVRMEPPPDQVPPGWEAEFAAICDSHRGRLVRWLTSIFGARDAEDIAQEALARLYVRPRLLDEDADAWPWLSVVARNVGRDMARHNAFSVAVGHETLEQVADDAHVPDAVVARDEACRLARALRAISPRDRALLHLRDVQGVSVTEIAETLGMNDNAVRQQLFRARKRLASAYTALGGERTGPFALLGLRAREFVRRHGHVFHGLGPAASGVWANALPAIAAIVGGALFAASAPPVVVRARTGGTAADLRDTAHGGGGVRTASYLPDAPGRGAAAPARARPGDPPILEFQQEVGPARARGKIQRSPIMPSEPGSSFAIEVTIEDVPVLGDFNMTIKDHTTGGKRLCEVTNTPCPPRPTPPPTPAAHR